MLISISHLGVLFATVILAFERSLSSVGPDMIKELVEVAEGLLAIASILALEYFEVQACLLYEMVH